MHRIRRIRQPQGRKVSILALVVLTFLAGVVAGGGPPFAGADSSLRSSQAYETFEEAWALIQDNYVDPGSINEDDLLYGATRGMVEAVGDTGHTVFIDPSRAAMMDVDLSGDYIGIGVQFDYNGTFPRVILVLPDSPAEEAGIAPGDLLTTIDGVDAWGMAGEELGAALPTGEGERVVLTFERDQKRSFRVKLELRQIEIDPVHWWMVDDTIAHLYLYEFTTGAADALDVAIDEAVAAGAESFILDLRNNGGGLIDELHKVAALFMPTGTPIYQQEDRNGNQDTIQVEGGTEFDYPLVVLVNRGTASSAEIIAAALSEAGIGTTVGETTYGTGTGLSIHTFDDGSVLFLGVVLWRTPSGGQIWKVGYEPEIMVRLYDLIDRVVPEDDGALSQDDLESGNDTQLQAAVALLSGVDVRA